jgi:FMN-dependent NADH-azoreductase
LVVRSPSSLLGFLGVIDVTVVRAEGLALGAQAKDSAISQALADIAALST